MKRTVHAVVIEGDLRVVFYIEADTIVSFNIGTHAIYSAQVNLQRRRDVAMLDFSRGDFAALAKLRSAIKPPPVLLLVSKAGGSERKAEVGGQKPLSRIAGDDPLVAPSAVAAGVLACRRAGASRPAEKTHANPRPLE